MTPWDRVYAQLSEPIGMGDTETYRRVADFTRDCPIVADWGCGGGGLLGWVEASRYRGIDWAATRYADITADLTTYRDHAPAVVLRHVLEHSYEWRTILLNACEAARRKLCIVLFTPWVGHTHVLNTEPDYDNVPVLAFARSDILDVLVGCGFTYVTETLELEWAHFGAETMIYATRR